MSNPWSGVKGTTTVNPDAHFIEPNQRSGLDPAMVGSNEGLAAEFIKKREMAKQMYGVMSQQYMYWHKKVQDLFGE